MKTIILCLALLCLPVLVLAQPDKVLRSKQFNVDESGLAIQGYDPVSYLSGTPRKGVPEKAIVHQGVKYLFADQANRDRFALDPARFEPVFGGWCAWAMLEGEKVEINPKRFKIINNRLYLFYDRFFTNTLKKWNKLAEKESEPVLVEKGDKNWQEILRK